jgi:hypothetical protein
MSLSSLRQHLTLLSPSAITGRWRMPLSWEMQCGNHLGVSSGGDAVWENWAVGLQGGTGKAWAAGSTPMQGRVHMGLSLLGERRMLDLGSQTG